MRGTGKLFGNPFAAARRVLDVWFKCAFAQEAWTFAPQIDLRVIRNFLRMAQLVLTTRGPDVSLLFGKRRSNLSRSTMS